MASFKSSARSVGYDPIDVPDNAERMAREGKERIEQLRQAYNADIQNRQNYVQAVREDNRRVNQGIKENKALDDQFKQTYKEALQKRYDQGVKNAREEAKNYTSNMERLSQFSQTILGEVSQMKERQNKEDEAFGSYLVSMYGVTPDDITALNTSEADLKAENTANNRVVNRLKAQGATPDQIQAIRNLDGWRLYGAEKVMAQQGGEAYAEFLQNPENRKKKYDLGDGRELSLEDVETNGTGADYKFVRSLMFAEWNKGYSNLDPAFASKYLYPNVRKADATDYANFQVKQNKQLEVDEKNDYKRDLGSIDFKTEPNGFQQFLWRDAGDDPKLMERSRLKALNQMLEDAQKGVLDPDYADAIFESEWIQNGKKTTFREAWMKGKGRNSPTGQLITAIENKVDDIRDQNFEREKADAARRKREAVQFARDQVEEGRDNNQPVSMQQLKELDAELVKEFGSGFSDADWRFLQADPLKEAEAIEIITGKLTAGEYIEPEFLQRLPLSKDIRDKYLELIAKRNPANGAKESAGVKSWLKGQLSGVIELTDDSEINQAFEDILPYALRRYQEVLNLKLEGNPDPFNAEQLARDQIEQEIKDGDQVFARTGKYGEKNFSWNVKSDKSRNTAALQVQTIMAHADTEVGRATVLGDTITYFGDANDPLKSTLAAQMKQMDRIGIGNNKAIYNLAQKFGLTEGQLIRRVLNDQGIATKMPSRYEVEEYVDPDLAAYIADRPFAGKTNKALKEQVRRQGGDGVERYKPMLELIRSKESSNDQVHGGYDAMNLGGTHGGHVPIGTGTGTNYFGQPLMNYSIRELLGMYDQKQIHAAGKYQFIGSTIRDLFDRGLVDPRITLDSKFDATTQDLLAIAYLDDTISTYKNGGQDDILYGLGRRWLGLKKLPQNKVREALEAITSDPRFQGAFGQINYEPGALVRFYKAGNIGPTSTGQHTDVKQFDNPRTPGNEFRAQFKYTDLDDYVVVADREFGNIGLGELRDRTGHVGDDFQDHVARGSHGIDYGTYDGDYLYLKNGAKVISSTPTEHGDAVLVELPDGRRFQFLHGKQA